MRSLKHACGAALTIVAWLSLWLSTAAAQSLPVARLYSVFPPGGKQGTTVDVSIVGSDLEQAGQLHFSNPKLTAAQKTQAPELGQEGPQPVAGAFTISIAPDAEPGICEVRAVGKYGISNPRAFVVSPREELIEKEPNGAREQATEVPLGATVSGQSGGAADEDYFKFSAKAGQRVIIDCWAYRIDSRMDATLVLYDAAGKELARNRDMNRRDPLLDFTAPSDGEYFVEVHDFLYEGNIERFYRLRIGADAYLDFVFPPAGLPGSNDTYTLYGRNLPGGQKSELTGADGKPLESLAVQIALPAEPGTTSLATPAVVEPEEAGIDVVPYALATPSGASNSVLVGLATAPVVAEQEPNDEAEKPQAVTPPCEYAGRFGGPNDRDWVSFEAKQGDVYWLEVFSQRMGLPTDPHLVVQQVSKNEKGEVQLKDVAAVDDYLDDPKSPLRRGPPIFEMQTSDPGVRFEAPADGTYRVLVRDLASYVTADPRLVYRLSIRRAQPDFRVVARPRLLPFSPDPNQNPQTVWSPLLRRGGSESIDVIVFRRDGFEGEVQVTAEGLPAGVSAAPVTIGPGQDVGAIVLTAADDAAESMSLVNLVGKARVGEAEIVRPARYATMVWGGQFNQVTHRSRLARNLAVAVRGEAAPLLVDLPSKEIEMCKGGKVQVPVKLVRRGDVKAVTLTPNELPPNVKKATLSLDEKGTEGNLEFSLATNTPPGKYSFALVASTQVGYARNPEAVTEAQARKAAVDKIAGELAASAKAAADAKAAAEKQAAELAAAMQKAQQAAAEAAKAADEAAAKAKAAADAKADAEKAMADAAAQAKTAADAKAVAEKTAAEAEAKAKQAAEVQKNVDKQLADATNAAKPQNINVALASPTVTLTVTEAPITLEVIPPASAQPGTTVEVPFKIARRYGFADTVVVKAKPTGDAKLKVPDVTLAADQNEGKLAVEIAGDAAPGDYRLEITATAKFNGQDLSTASTAGLTLAAPAAAAQ